MQTAGNIAARKSISPRHVEQMRLLTLCVAGGLNNYHFFVSFR